MAQVFLTESLVRSVSCPSGKQQEIIWDCPIGEDGKVRHGAIAGLGLRVTGNGHKAFIHSYQFNGRRCRHVLGSATLLSVASARLMAQERELQINAGVNPEKERTDYRRVHTLTVRELVDEYFAGRLSRLSQSNQRSFRSLVAPWLEIGLKPGRGGPKRRTQVPFGLKHATDSAEKITPSQIANFVNGIASDYQANAALRHIKAMYNWGLKMQLIDMRNPCDPIELRRTQRQRREYTDAQIRNLIKAIFNPPLLVPPLLCDLTGTAKRDAALNCGAVTQANEQLVELCAFMGILLLTMARPSDVRNAEFSHFDLDRLIWHKHNTKGLKLSRRVAEFAYRSVPIHPRVAELVAAQHHRWPEAQHLFPCHTDPARPRNNFHRALKRFRALPEVPDHFQLYDLKRIAISLMLTGQGVSREAVSHYVDHRGNLETTMIYDLGLVDPLRPVTERLGALLEV
ncbi:integrase family protein [Oricola sp.]|uniref:tyrosine-type recombinase/integrase n=1 Tax=Oricola sp. TaxID=1979950 RepID=UPI0025D7A75B|nr:integrase family protein [Oricola sp.]MCI5076863.1 integrase family protein [Oricola sp.]